MSKRKTVRPGVREISPVIIYGEVYGGKDFRKSCKTLGSLFVFAKYAAAEAVQGLVMGRAIPHAL